MKKNIIIEILGTGCKNKGAEMMLLTILQELKDDNFKFVINPHPENCNYEFYSKLGLYPKANFKYMGINFNRVWRYIPKRFRDMFGLITEDEIDIVLDSSGFAYGDQWGSKIIKKMAIESKRWRRMNKKLIFLPQAFGPFGKQSTKKYMREIIKNASLIYARDRFSYNALIEIENENKIRLCPDFTVLFKGVKPYYFNEKIHQIAIIPNHKMISKTFFGILYEEFLLKVISELKKKNLSTYFLIFGGEKDKKLAYKINERLNNKIPIIDEQNSYYIKGLIENSMGVVSSRFHGIASGLYSGVPTLGTGWSHKYYYLFKDFYFEEGLIEIEKDFNKLDEKISFFIEEEKKKKLLPKLKETKKIYEERVKNMFNEVKEIIDKTTRN